MTDPNLIFDEAILQQAAALLAELVKRQRAVSEMPSSSHVPSHYAHDNERAGRTYLQETLEINALYERYLRNLQNSYGTETGQSTGGFDDLVEINNLSVLGLGYSKPDAQSQSSVVRPETALPPDSYIPEAGTSTGGLDELVEINDLSVLGLGCSKPDAQSQSSVVRPKTALPPDATPTLYVEGLPARCTRREVSHIFRPFLGYKEVRVVLKEPRRPGREALVLCFVDFESPAHAATAKDALQGYIFDEHDRDSCHLRLQFSHTPGAKTGFKNHGRQWD